MFRSKSRLKILTVQMEIISQTGSVQHSIIFQDENSALVTFKIGQIHSVILLEVLVLLIQSQKMTLMLISNLRMEAQIIVQNLLIQNRQGHRVLQLGLVFGLYTLQINKTKEKVVCSSMPFQRRNQHQEELLHQTGIHASNSSV